MEESGAKVESASTAISKLLNNIALDLKKAAQIAGESEASFTKLFAEKPQEALLKYAAGLQKNKASFAEIAAGFKDAGEEGARVISTLATLGVKTDFFKEKIKEAGSALKDTTQIQAAFQLKNETFGAELDKLSKRLTNIFINGKVSEFFKDLVGGINDLITPTKSAVQQFDELDQKVTTLEKNIVPLAKRYDELKSKTILNKDEQVELKNIIKQLGDQMPFAISAFDQYGNAISINTSRIYEFITAEKPGLKW